MVRRLVFLCVMFLLAGRMASAQSNAQTRFTAAPHATAPAHCTVGDLYTKTGASAGLKLCTATDTWTDVATGLGGGAGTPADPVNSVQFNDAGSFGGFGGWDGTNFFPPNISTTTALDFYSEIPDDVIDATELTPVLAGAGAGNLSNGVYSYKFTFKNYIGGGLYSGETAASAATPTVTVTDASTDGKVTVLKPYLCDQASGERVNIYRTVANGSVYKLVAASQLACGGTFTDNVADASLSATAPTTNTTLFSRLTFLNGALRPSEADGFAVPVLNIGLPTDAAEYGSDATVWQGIGIIATGPNTTDTDGLGLWVSASQGSGTGNGGVIAIKGGASNGTGDGGDAVLMGGEAGTNASGGYATLQPGTGKGGGNSGGAAYITGGTGLSGANGGNVILVGGAASGGGTNGSLSITATNVVINTKTGVTKTTGCTITEITNGLITGTSGC